MKENQTVEELLEQGFEALVCALGKMGYPVDEDVNFSGTARRAADGFRELVVAPVDFQLEQEDILHGGGPVSGAGEGMVLCKGVRTFGLCPHHLLPVMYTISLAYVPGDRVLGLSKLARLVRLFARRPVLQETLTQEVVTWVMDQLGALGAAIRVEGFHLCMAARGSHCSEASVVTVRCLGVFEGNSSLHREFLASL